MNAIKLTRRLAGGWSSEDDDIERFSLRDDALVVGPLLFIVVRCSLTALSSGVVMLCRLVVYL